MWSGGPGVDQEETGEKQVRMGKGSQISATHKLAAPRFSGYFWRGEKGRTERQLTGKKIKKKKGKE